MNKGNLKKGMSVLFPVNNNTAKKNLTIVFLGHQSTVTPELPLYSKLQQSTLEGQRRHPVPVCWETAKSFQLAYPISSSMSQLL
jgi:hypothetical protein